MTTGRVSDLKECGVVMQTTGSISIQPLEAASRTTKERPRFILAAKKPVLGEDLAEQDPQGAWHQCRVYHCEVVLMTIVLGHRDDMPSELSA